MAFALRVESPMLLRVGLFAGACVLGAIAAKAEELGPEQAKAFVAGGFRFASGKQQADWLDADTLLISRDFGPGTIDGEPVAGHGLMGMRERATLAGGTFSAGPARGGGFEVDVTLPVTEPAP